MSSIGVAPPQAPLPPAPPPDEELLPLEDELEDEDELAPPVPLDEELPLLLLLEEPAPPAPLEDEPELLDEEVEVVVDGAGLVVSLLLQAAEAMEAAPREAKKRKLVVRMGRVLVKRVGTYGRARLADRRPPGFPRPRTISSPEHPARGALLRMSPLAPGFPAEGAGRAARTASRSAPFPGEGSKVSGRDRSC